MDSDICVCIPTLNEEEAIGNVIQKFYDEGYENILVIDGGSDDDTVRIAKEYGVDIHLQTFDGDKGSAIQEAIEVIDSSIIVFVDGDDTYEPRDINKLVTAIENGADHAIANRFANLNSGSMSKLHQFGNKFLNTTFYMLYRENVKDLLTGYRAIRKESIMELDIESQGFEIETEITAKSVLKNHTIEIVPSSYYQRRGESKLQSYTDGVNIFKKIVELKFR